MRNILALSLPFDFVFLMALLGSNKDHSLTISHGFFVFLVVISIAYFVILSLALMLTSTSKEITK